MSPRPHVCPADYYNRKGWHSIVLQGTVDFRGLFIDLYVGWPGRVHDARVFSNSSLYRKGQRKTLLPNKPVTLGGTDAISEPPSPSFLIINSLKTLI